MQGLSRSTAAATVTVSADRSTPTLKAEGLPTLSFTREGPAEEPGVEAPENTKTPRVTGPVVAGKKVTCSPGGWTGDSDFSFEWRANGVRIAGATTRTYKACRSRSLPAERP